MIEAKKICFNYSDFFYLRNISFEIKAGEIFGIIGESGSGKSTLIKILAGELDAMEGEVLLENQILPKPSTMLIKGNNKIKVVTQQNTLFPNITVFENIAYSLRFFKKDYQVKRINYLIKLLNISNLKEKLPRELSGGEVQRVMIAKAIADEPKVLLLDEPFSNLDVLIKKKVILELKKILVSEQIACAIVTHEIEDAFGFVDELIIMKNGRLVQKGKSEQVYFKPKNTYVARLTGEAFVFKNEQNENVICRPENFVISSAGKYKSTVNFCRFKGAYFEIYFDFLEQQIFARTNTKFEIGDELKFNITEETKLLP